MPEIFLPQKIYFGENSIKKFTRSDFESVLIISDKDDAKKSEFAKKVKENFGKKVPVTELIIDPDLGSLHERSIKYISENETDRIVAVGSAGLIDTAMLLSYQSGIGFS
ncbi:MAG TPA: hypothetical protein DCS04_03465, partial [Ruminococcaceae bacterium]|nr:hypothetical protein [Oscillospiraceae bacterium]